MDQDSNDRVVWQEFKAYHPDMSRTDFDKADADKDGTITHEEWFNYDDKPKMGRNALSDSGKGAGYGKGAGAGKGKGYGQGKGQGKLSTTRFSQMDANGDAGISYDELKVQVKDASPGQFKQADSDGNGSLDHNEWAHSKDFFGFSTGVGKGKRQ